MIAKKKRRRESMFRVGAAVATTQEAVASTLINSYSKKTCVRGSLQGALGAEVIARTHDRIVPQQMAISTALSKPVVHADLRAANNARLTTAIADLWHAENIPDRTVMTPRFKEVIDAARMVGMDYKLPNRNHIGGYLLQENAAAYKKENYQEVTRDGPKFGYTLEGDGATVIKRPLLNGLIMNGNCYPVVACVRDCSEHLAEGGSKNCTYIADVFSELVKQYDPKGTDTDIFYFDGAANVQKAGRILEARYPRTTTLYGGEHALALWFSKVAKIPAIRVGNMLLFACFFVFTND